MIGDDVTALVHGHYEELIMERNKYGEHDDR